MSDQDPGLTAPPFDAQAALQRLQRELRGLGLSEREGHFEQQGLRMARAALDASGLRVAIVKRPSRNSPEWQARVLSSDAQLRDWLADLKRKLSAWGDADR